MTSITPPHDLDHCSNCSTVLTLPQNRSKMDAREHLFYGLGMVAFAVACADGAIQHSEKQELHELVEEWADRYDINYEISEIIFSILQKSKPSLEMGFQEGMHHIELGSNHLNEQLKEHFEYLVRDVAHAFPPVTTNEQNIIDRFKEALRPLS